MAEPAHRLDDDQPKGIYDEATGTAPSDPRPQLRALEGGSQTTPRQTDHLKPANAETGTSQNLYRAESSPGANEYSFYRQQGAHQNKKFSARKILLSKRGAAGGGVIGAIIALIMGFTLLSGPAQMVQLSRVLHIPSSKGDSDTHNRLGKLYRFAKTGDVGETRVNRLGSKFFGSTIDQLREKGVTFSRNALTGRPTKTTIDTDKLQDDFPELKGASTADRKAFLADKLGVNVEQIDGSGTIFTIDQTEMDVKSASLLSKSTVGLLDKNGLVNAIKTRELAKFFDLPSLFHPLKRAVADKENQVINASQRRKQQQDEQQREAQLTEGVEAEGATAVGDIKDQSRKYNSTAMKALLLTGGVCFVRGITGDIVQVNHDLVVLPSEIRAMDALAVGEQIESGQDVNMSQVQTIEEGFTDPSTGKNIWQGRALNALSHSGEADTSLEDTSPDYTQAFSGDTTAANIKAFVDKALTIKLPLGVKIDAASYACSPAGIALQIGGGLFLTASSLIAEVGSVGTLTPAVVGVWAAKEGASFAISAVAMHFVSGFILNSNTAKLAANAFSGATGGDLLAYGARAAANTTAIASGGISLANDASTIADNNQQLQSESIADRLLNPYNYNSAVGKLIQQSTGSPLNNVAKLGGIFTNFGSMFSHSLAAISPKAMAANKQYDWGFPQYGLPDSVLNDPNLDDPYANADYVAGLLDGSNGHTFQSRAEACFGVDISKQDDGSGGQIWDVIPRHEVDPQSSKYLNATCNDSSEDWHRIMMFVFDTTTMKAAACYQGDDQSCADLGAGSESAPTANPAGDNSGGTSTSTGGSIPSGSAQDLAKQLLPYLSDGKLKCNSLSGNIGCSDITNTAKGVSIKGGQGCQVDSLDPQLLGMLLKLLQMNHTFTLSAICSDHHDDGLSEHAGGKAADFNIIDGVFMGPSASEPWDSEKLQAAQKLDQDIVAFMPAGSVGFGQVGVNSSGATCHAPFSFMSGYSTYPDDCHHQHVQVLK